MLVKKSPEVGNIVAVKISRSEEVIGKFVSQEGNKVSLSLPLMVQPMQDPQGNLAMGFVPYSYTAEDEQVFEFTGMLFTPRDDVKKGYVRQTSSLELPTNSGIILPK